MVAGITAILNVFGLCDLFVAGVMQLFGF